MQSTGVEYETSQPGWTERVLVADHHVHVVVMLLETGRWQGSLLHQSITRDVVIDSGAQKPLRLLRLRPVEAGGGQIIAKGHRNIGRDRYRLYAVDQSQRSE